jgi:type I restriction enzyme S subunit
MRATKDSGVDWLGEIPADWVMKPCWSYFRRVKQTGLVGEELLSVYRDHGVVPKASRDDNHNVESEDLSSYQLVRVGDMVMNKMKAWQGSIALSDFRGIVSPAYFVYRPTHEFSRKYFHYLMRSAPYIGEYNRISKGVRIGQWDLDPTYFRTTQLIVPPPEEQQAIADFLDRETAKIDTLIAKQEQLITTLGERRKAVIWRGVTQSVGAVKLGVGARLDWKLIVPNSWRVKPLWMVTGFSTGWTPPSGNDAFYSDEYPWVNISDLGPRELRTTVKGLSSFATNSIRLKKTLRGQLMFSFKLSIGQVSFAGLECYTNEAIASFHSSEQLRLDYAFYMLPICVPENAGENIYGAKMLNAQRIKTARIILPPLEEQESVASFLNGATTKIDSLIARARKANAFLVERRQSLISAAVTGKIDLSKGV